jgi:hypothetical protein
MEAAKFSGSCAALGKPAGMCERWLTAFSRSTLRLPRPVDLRELSGWASGFAETLGVALSDPACAPGSPSLREVEKRLTFIGGSLGTGSGSSFDVTALIIALRDLLAGEAASPVEKAAIAGLFDWLGAVAHEGYSSSQREGAWLRAQESLDRGTPIFVAAREVPCLLLLGEPGRAVAETLLGRLLLTVVRVGARAIVLDGSGLMSQADPTLLEAVSGFARHPRMKDVAIVIAGLPVEIEETWRAACGREVLPSERLEEAIELARTL